MDTGRPFLVELPIRVQGYDIDVIGRVSNIVYVRWLEDLRMELLATYFPFEECVRRGVSPVLLRTEVHYHHPVKMFDPVRGRIWVTGMGRTSWEIGAEFVVGEKVMASGRQRGCFVSLATGRPAPVPEWLVSQWQAWQTAGIPPQPWSGAPAHAGETAP
ncbi:MAG: acyl-CoA thioesterase [Chloroflexi bacterium]|nr:acyl-CoA thioesterase [Chloroflexota bacterium]GIW11902.1 MAG: acyl-CoA thioesterase [Dehalococcoidia bacterium]